MEYISLAIALAIVITAVAAVFSLGVVIGWRAKSDLSPIPTVSEVQAKVMTRTDEEEYEIAKKRGDQ